MLILRSRNARANIWVMDGRDRSNRLRLELERAREAYLRASTDYTDVLNQIPSGLPSPDGAQRITNASNAKTQALQNYTEAMRVYGDYLTKPKDGI